METQRFTQQSLKRAAELVREGELIAFPTETVYGLGANALLEQAVAQVYQVKGRPSDNPLIVHVCDRQMMQHYSEALPEIANKLIEQFWPGPLTLILPMKPGSFSPLVTGGLTTVAFRMPDHRLTLQLIAQAGVPLVGPSANTSGKPSPTTADHVLHDLQGKIAGVLDGGATQIGVESTVLDLSDPLAGPLILRPGAVTLEQLEEVIGKGSVGMDQHLVTDQEAPKAPGMKYKHYAPDAPVWIVKNTATEWRRAIEWARGQKKRVGLFADQATVDQFNEGVHACISFGPNSVEEATKQLFSGLRALDQEGVEIIFAPAFPEQGLGAAYMNRLKKAAGQKFF